MYAAFYCALAGLLHDCVDGASPPSHVASRREMELPEEPLLPEEQAQLLERAALLLELPQ